MILTTSTSPSQVIKFIVIAFLVHKIMKVVQLHNKGINGVLVAN
jgi:cell shape-determining protein MreD